MFTGLVEEIGQVSGILSNREGKVFSIKTTKVSEGTKLGDSISVDGTCLSVIDINKNILSVQAVNETLQKTTLNLIKTNDKVNLERAMLANGRFGGHIVQGHIDGTGRMISLDYSGDSGVLVISVSSDIAKYIVKKGSITINGISLTVADISNNLIKVAVIPITLKETNLGIKKSGDYLNIETDILAKYVEKLVIGSPKESLIENIKKWGY